MPDKKTPIGKTGSKKPEKTLKKESKSDLFLRIATPRVKNILKALRILGNCSNRSNYEYTKEQYNEMFNAIRKYTDLMYSKFMPSKVEQESFEFQ